jgi:hypothetical protein
LLSPQLKDSVKLWAIKLESPKAAYFYAKIILNGPFPEGEPAIAQSPKWSYYYAKEILQHRFEAGEPVLAHSSSWWFDYWLNVLDGEWPKEMSEALLEARALWGSKIERGY